MLSKICEKGWAKHGDISKWCKWYGSKSSFLLYIA
jgi:hypothetical protein